jgi:hypothetical protein
MVHFVTKVSLHFWKQHKNSVLLIHILTYFKKNKILTLYSELLTFLGPKMSVSQEMGNSKEIIYRYCNLVLEFSPQCRSVCSSMSNFQNHWTLLAMQAVLLQVSRLYCILFLWLIILVFILLVPVLWPEYCYWWYAGHAGYFSYRSDDYSASLPYLVSSNFTGNFSVMKWYIDEDFIW